MTAPGRFLPTSPPRFTLIPELKTVPVAYELVILPFGSVLLLDSQQSRIPLMPTSPPPVPEAPTVTEPVAYERSMVPVFTPTRPPPNAPTPLLPTVTAPVA